MKFKKSAFILNEEKEDEDSTEQPLIALADENLDNDYRDPTSEERAVKNYIIDLLNEGGYHTYATHLFNYDFHLTVYPGVAAYVNPEAGTIVLNRYFGDEDLISLLIRHELLHQILRHCKKAVDRIALSKGYDPTELSDEQKDEVYEKVYRQLDIPGFEQYGKSSITNIAADLHLSKYYNPDKDFETAKKGDFFGQELGGLVMELDRPDLMDKSYEEILDILEKEERNYRRQSLEEVRGNLIDAQTFVADEDEEED